MDYILGLDGGGTKTTTIIADNRGSSITSSEFGSSNYKSVGIKNARENINNAIISAIKNLGLKNEHKLIFKSACFGLAGNDSNEDKKIYKEIIFNNIIERYLDENKIIICNDTRIGLAAGSNSKNGVMIICGTGSNCYGVNEQGKEAKVNGWDYILGDEGSGYEVGRKALKALMKAYDGRGEGTLLSETILEDLKVKNIPGLIKWAYNDSFFKDKIAAIAKTVCRTAEMKDDISIKILQEEANEAFVSIKAVTKKLNLIEKEFDLVFVGSVFKCEKYFKNVLIDKLKEKFPRINIMPLTKKPVEGAIKLALENK